MAAPCPVPGRMWASDGERLMDARLMRALVVVCALASPALALPPMTAEEFEAHVTGKTLDYSLDGAVYGREVYLPGRRVHWARTGGDCKTGTWYPEGRQICFLYADDPTPKCWSLWPDGTGLAGRFATDSLTTSFHRAREAAEPLICPGLDLGS